MRKLLGFGLVAVFILGMTGNAWAQDDKSHNPEPLLGFLRLGVINVDYRPKDIDKTPVDNQNIPALSMGIGTRSTYMILGFNPSNSLFVGNLGLERNLKFLVFGAGALLGKAHQDMPQPTKYRFLVPYISFGLDGHYLYINSKLGLGDSYRDVSVGFQVKFKE